MSDQAIATDAPTKRYRGDVLAVDGINLRVARGEIYAFLGPNGAGKSTTIPMLLGMIKPTAGFAELFGDRAARDQTGWMTISSPHTTRRMTWPRRFGLEPAGLAFGTR